MPRDADGGGTKYWFQGQSKSNAQHEIIPQLRSGHSPHPEANIGSTSQRMEVGIQGRRKWGTPLSASLSPPFRAGVREAPFDPASPSSVPMSYKRVVNAKRTKREEAIEEAVALTTRELSKEDQRIVSLSGTCNLCRSRLLSSCYSSVPDCSSNQAGAMDVHSSRDRVHQVGCTCSG